MALFEGSTLTYPTEARNCVREARAVDLSAIFTFVDFEKRAASTEKKRGSRPLGGVLFWISHRVGDCIDHESTTASSPLLVELRQRRRTKQHLSLIGTPDRATVPW